MSCSTCCCGGKSSTKKLSKKDKLDLKAENDYVDIPLKSSSPPETGSKAPKKSSKLINFEFFQFLSFTTNLTLILCSIKCKLNGLEVKSC